MRNQMNKTILSSLIFGLVISALIPAADAAETIDGYTLLIQQSPVGAGSVSPGAGVHKIQIGQTVSLSAIPKQGYRFLYWLGDVSATGTPDTTIQLNSPKMVVAVFTRQEYEEELPGVSLIKGAYAGGGGGGRLIGTPMQSPAGVNPGGYSYYNPGDVINNIDYPDSDETPDDDIPVPDNDNDDIPVPNEDGTEVPEPSTILLLAFGSIAFFRRK
ncbi:MAG: PEP-CTERM sorting domain-containing protein [Phycisphaerae bacterium]|nr:PEP-CTERM sorting domain-containing protein [Phycisphaerae bacterium]